MLNYLASFGIGAGLGYCVFFKPKSDLLEEYKNFQKQLEMTMASKLRMMVWHEGIDFDNPFSSNWDRLDQVFTPFIDAKLNADYHNPSKGMRPLMLPEIRMDHMEWR